MPNMGAIESYGQVAGYHQARLDAVIDTLRLDGVVATSAYSVSVPVLKGGDVFKGLLNNSGLSVSDKSEPVAVEKRYEPEHPLADSSGHISRFKVDKASLTLEALEAYRHYETLVRIVGVQGKMSQKSMEIGR